VEKVENVEKANRKLEKTSVALERSGKETTGWSVPVISLFPIFKFCPKTIMLFQVFAWLFLLFQLFPVLAATGAASQLKSGPARIWHEPLAAALHVKKKENQHSQRTFLFSAEDFAGDL
jgi:hypothetical protein